MSDTSQVQDHASANAGPVPRNDAYFWPSKENGMVPFCIATRSTGILPMRNEFRQTPSETLAELPFQTDRNHHGVFDLSYLRHLPAMTLMAPKDENELRHMLKTAIYSDVPMALRYPRGSGFGVLQDSELKCLEIGTGEILAEGTDATIIAIGGTVYPACEAAEKLKSQGISAGVVNARFVKPLDAALILAVARATGRIVTVEENVLQGGFGSAVLELLHDNNLQDVRIRRLGISDCFVEQGSQVQLRRDVGIDAEGIAAAVTTLLRRE